MIAQRFMAVISRAHGTPGNLVSLMGDCRRPPAGGRAFALQ